MALAFLVAPFVGPIVGGLVGNYGSEMSDSLPWLYYFVYTTVAILRYFGWLITLALSVPVYLAMRRLGWLDWWRIMLAWAIVQGLSAVVAAVLLPGAGVFIPTSFIEGALDGLAFRLIAGKTAAAVAKL